MTGFDFVRVTALAAATLLLCGGFKHDAIAGGSLPVVFVNGSVAASGDGTSWEAAFKFLYEALELPGDKEVWVAQGLYKPRETTVLPALRRFASLSIGPGDRVYGGFAGTETSREQRDFSARPTTLSGNIQSVGSTADNSYTVVTFQSSADSTSILDGFTVTAGNETRTVASVNAGGVKNLGGSPLLANLRVTANRGRAGVGFYSSGGAPVITNVEFSDNETQFGEANVFVAAGGSPVILSSIFVGAASGTLLEHSGASITISNSEFNGGGAADGLALAEGSTATVTDSSFEGMNIAVAAPTVDLKRVRFTDDETAVALRSGTIDGVLIEDSVAGLRAVGNVAVSNSTFIGTSQAVVAEGGEEPGVRTTLVNTTIAGGVVAVGTNEVTPTVGRLTIEDSILVDVSFAFEADESELVLTDLLIPSGCPVDPRASCSGALLTSDPELGPLRDNGGFTRTMAPAFGSPALDAGNNSTCALIDQRGVARPVDGDGDGIPTCDLGAVELDPPDARFASATSVVTEGTTAMISVLVDPHAQPLTVDYAVTGGTATNGGVDYTLAAGTVTFPAHVFEALIAVPIAADGLQEPAETVVMTLSNIAGEALLVDPRVHTLTISGTPARVAFRRASSALPEKDDEVLVTAVLNHAVAGAVSVKYRLSGTATNGQDFILKPGTLRFAIGETEKGIVLGVKDDSRVERVETIVLTLFQPTGAALGSRTKLTVTIRDDEPQRLKCQGRAATFAGTGAGDVILGTSGVDVIVSGGGNDDVKALGGADFVCAGRGNDTVDAGGGNDVVQGDAGNDTLRGANGKDQLKGGGGNDSLIGSGGGDTIMGERGTDTLDGSAGRDRLSGGPGPGDRCDGGKGVDVLLAGHACETVAGVP